MDVETNRENTTSNRPNENNSDSQTGFRKFRSFRIPVKVGEEYDVKIEAMSKRGDAGVGRIQGLVIFVPNTKVGDKVKLLVLHKGDRKEVTVTLEEIKE